MSGAAMRVTTAAALPAEPVHFERWIDEIRPTLQPPVANRLLYKDDLKVMVVGGPNIRKDFHLEIGEELFFQMKGDMRLDIMDRGKLRQIPIKEGEIFLLPGCIPHSPQRFADTVGLVIERERDPTEIDGLRWYVGNTDEVLYEEYFHCTDLGVQLVPVIERFMASDMYKSGKPDPHAPPPSHTFNVDMETSPPAPISLSGWLAANPTSSVLFESEFIVHIVRTSTGAVRDVHGKGEVFFFQHAGRATLTVCDAAGDSRTIHLDNGDVYLLPGGFTYSVTPTDDTAVTMTVRNKHFE